MTRPLITVFGATGAQGGGLARSLLTAPQREFRVRAVTRRPGGDGARVLAALGAEILEADLDDAAGVRRALQGAYGAFCVTSFWEHLCPQKELAQAETMAEAARLEGVRHVVWSTLEDTRRFFPLDDARLPTLMGRYKVPHFDAKGEANRFFIGRGVPVTLLHTSDYWENLVHSGMGPRRTPGGELVLALPLGELPVPWIAAADIGACAASLFRLGEAAIGRSIGIAGEHLSGAQMARSLSTALGEPVRYRALGWTQYAQRGFPGAAGLASMFRFKHDFNDAHRALRPVAATRELHPGLLDFDAWLALHASEIPIAAPAQLA